MFAIDENGQWLLQNLYTTDKSGRRRSTASEVQQRLAEITFLIHNLTEEVKNRKTRINAILSESQSFEDSSIQFDKWLRTVERQVANEKPVSVNPDELKEQAIAHEVCKHS